MWQNLAEKGFGNRSSLPPPFNRFATTVAEQGMVEMTLATKSTSCPTTLISRLKTKAPLLVQRALYPDRSMAQMAHIVLMSSSGGILQGDRLSVDIAAGAHTVSRITTQASTKVYKMFSGFASQKVRILAGRGSYLEFLPHSIIPFKHARFFQEVSIQISSSATVLYAETLSAGRIAHGEEFDFDIYFMKFTARSGNGKLLFADNLKVEPTQKTKQLITNSFGGKTILSTIYIFCPSGDTDSIERSVKPYFAVDRNQYSVEKGFNSIIVGFSRLPDDRGIVAKMLSNSIDKIRAATETISACVKGRVCKLDDT